MSGLEKRRMGGALGRVMGGGALGLTKYLDIFEFYVIFSVAIY